jgi:hypothetical protein
MFSRFAVLAALVPLLAAASPETWPEPESIAALSDYPDPLVFRSGKVVATRREWEHRRRPELKALFEHYMYGKMPPKPRDLRFRTVATHRDFLDGLSTLRLVRIEFGDSDAPSIDLMVVVPNAAKGRVPAFLAMNFCGNHQITMDPRVPVARGWTYKSCKGCTDDNHSAEAGRGGQQVDWPIGEILRHGYGFATFCSSDLESDRGDVSDGLMAWWARSEGRPVEARDRGTIAAWAWGFHRAMDYLATDASIDSKRVAAVGHSRNGKTALLAAAFDERIALAIPHQAGCGGTAPSRGHVGESVERINRSFPHWFNAEFKRFGNQPERLPFDQNALVALMAPRPVLLSNAEEDQWANPAGQFEVLRGAEPVYRLLGAGGVGTDRMPTPGVLSKGKLGFYIRPGRHSMTVGDWRVFMEYADAHLRTGAAK